MTGLVLYLMVISCVEASIKSLLIRFLDDAKTANLIEVNAKSYS